MFCVWKMQPLQGLPSQLLDLMSPYIPPGKIREMMSTMGVFSPWFPLVSSLKSIHRTSSSRDCVLYRNAISSALAMPALWNSSSKRRSLQIRRCLPSGTKRCIWSTQIKYIYIYIYMYIIVYDYICICNMYIYIVYIYMGLGLVGRKNIMNISCWESEEPPNISSQAGLWHQPSCPAAQLPSSHTVPHHQSWHLVRNNSSCLSVNVLCTALAQFCLGHHVFARRKKVRNQKWKTQHWLHVEFSHVATPNQASFAGAHHYHDYHWETDHAKGCLMTFLHDEPQVA